MNFEQRKGEEFEEKFKRFQYDGEVGVYFPTLKGNIIDVKSFLTQALKEQREEILAGLPEEKDPSTSHPKYWELQGYNQCLTEVREGIKGR